MIVLFYATLTHELRKASRCRRGRPRVFAHIVSALNTLICAIGLPYEEVSLFTHQTTLNQKQNTKTHDSSSLWKTTCKQHNQLVFYYHGINILKIVWNVDKVVWTNLVAHIRMAIRMAHINCFHTNFHQSGLVLPQVAAGIPSTLDHLALYKPLYTTANLEGEIEGLRWGCYGRVRAGPGEREERHVVQLWRWQITPPLFSPSPSLTNSQFEFHIFGPHLDLLNFTHQPITLLNRIHDSCPSVHTIFCYSTWCELGLRVRVLSVIS